MAAVPLYPQRTSAARQKQQIRTPGHNLFAKLWESPAAANTHQPWPLQPVEQPAHSHEIFLEGYTFFKADALPSEQATWRRAERTPVLRKQSKLWKMVRKRAFKVSAAQQYHSLDTDLQQHINRLVHDKRTEFPGYDWSCSYAKRHKRPDWRSSKSQVVAMDVIIMRRPLTARYRRTPMGDLVDLDVPVNASRRNKESNHALRTETDIPASQLSSLEEEEHELLELGFRGINHM